MENVQPPDLPAQQPDTNPAHENQWILFLNLSAFAGLLVPTLGHILGPLIIWLIKKPESARIDAAGRAVLNFQISWTIWAALSAIIAVVGSCLIIPFILPVAVGIAWIVFVIIGSIKASNGESYTFPLTIKFL